MILNLLAGKVQVLGPSYIVDDPVLQGDFIVS